MYALRFAHLRRGLPGGRHQAHGGWRGADGAQAALEWWPFGENPTGKALPFVVDTGLFCRHINPNGETFPDAGSLAAFKRGGD